MFEIFRKQQQPMTVGIQVTSGFLSLLVLDITDHKQPKIKDYINRHVNNVASLEEVAAEVREYVEDKQLLKVKCCFVLAEEDYQLLTVEAPNVPKEELNEALKWKVKDLISYPIDDVFMDTFTSPQSNSSAQDIANVVVVHKDIINNITSFAESAGVSLSVIDIPEMSYRNYLETTQYHKKSVAIVLVKENYGKLIVVQNDNVLFSRSFSINYKAGLFDELPESEIALELQRSLDYYERQLKQQVPNTVIFIGENITDDKITTIIKDSLNQEVIVGKIDGIEDSDTQHLASGRLIATYGGALRRELYL